MRRFVRHPGSIPIQLSAAQGRGADTSLLHNIGAGGLSCSVDEALPAGCPVVLSFPKIWPDYRVNGVVAWCRPQRQGFEVGIQFSNKDAFRLRMVEQLSQIEAYRQQMLTEQGRALDGEQAAQEWISLHAGEFAAAFPSPEEGASDQGI